MRLSFLASAFLQASPAYAISNLTILADNATSVAVSRLAREYARISGTAVATSFVTRQQQSEQIMEGSAADILITSDTKWLEQLKEQGLVDVYSRITFARGRMALIGPEDSAVTLRLTDSFVSAPLVHAMNFQPLLYVGNPEYVSDGRYAKEALRSLGALDVLEPYMLYLKSTTEMLDEVRTQHAYAVVNYGQAMVMEHVRVIDIFPETSHSPINYYAVVIAGDNMQAARQFIKFAGSAQAKNTIRNAGMLNP